MNISNDYLYSKKLQEEFDRASDINSNKSPSKSNPTALALLRNPDISVVSPQWELLDPNPNIFILFQHYDASFFYSKLKAVEVRWSPRMTTCAGLCAYEGHGRLCSIRLSTPLLKLRPRTDLVETLLDRDGHGPEFQSHMKRINQRTGSKISIYHSFHDEVKLYKQHWWKCNGPCHKQPPFYGMVKRAMNRAPSKNDTWWASHKAKCNGEFIKVHEPDGFKAKPSKSKLIKVQAAKDNEGMEAKPPRISTIDGILIKKPNSDKTPEPHSDFKPFTGLGRVLGGASSQKQTSKRVINNIIEAYDKRVALQKQLTTPRLSEIPSNSREIPSSMSTPKNNKNSLKNITTIISPDIRDYFKSPSKTLRSSDSIIILSDSSDDDEMLMSVPMPDVHTPPHSNIMVKCPNCTFSIENHKINQHLDNCLS